MKQGLSISEYGVKTVETGEVFTTRDEAELYEFLGYQFIPPELRENLGELDAARKGELPELVEVEHLRGDLHVHSTWSSDGKNTIEEMARRCIERGYQYMAITDHSHYLREGRLEAQWREIDAAEREARAVSHPARDRGEHPGERRRSTSRTSCSRSSTGSSHRCTRRSTRTRPSGSSARWRTRTSTASGTRRPEDQQARRRPTSTSSV